MVDGRGSVGPVCDSAFAQALSRFKGTLKSKTRDLSDRGFSVFSATPLDMDFCAWMMQ